VEGRLAQRAPHNVCVAPTRLTFQAPADAVRQVLIDVLSELGYDVSWTGDWSMSATKGSVSRNIALGGFGQRMDFHFAMYADPVLGVIVDVGPRDQTGSALLGGAVGLAKTSRELSAICSAIASRLA